MLKDVIRITFTAIKSVNFCGKETSKLIFKSSGLVMPPLYRRKSVFVVSNKWLKSDTPLDAERNDIHNSRDDAMTILICYRLINGIDAEAYSVSQINRWPSSGFFLKLFTIIFTL